MSGHSELLHLEFLPPKALLDQPYFLLRVEKVLHLHPCHCFQVFLEVSIEPAVSVCSIKTSSSGGDSSSRTCHAQSEYPEYDCCSLPVETGSWLNLMH